jgi:hypothetical protein
VVDVAEGAQCGRGHLGGVLPINRATYTSMALYAEVLMYI